jgi:hypothetical protein
MAHHANDSIERQTPDLPPNVLFSDLELKLLRGCAKKPSTALTVV